MSECECCFGYGFWAWGPIAPMGSMDAEDGVPTIECPECDASPNPIENKERFDHLKKLHKEGKLKFGDKEGDELQEAWRLANE